MDDCERLEDMEAILDDLAERAERGAVVLVEGLRDKASLEALHIRGSIVLTSQKQLFTLAERVSRMSKDVIILTDWDERGEEVARNIEAFIKSNGARPDGEPRKKLGHLTKKEINEVENLYGYVERLRHACATKQKDMRR